MNLRISAQTLTYSFQILMASMKGVKLVSLLPKPVIVDQATHITKDSSSCINFIFSSNPSFISASGVELSLHYKCRHNLIYGKINFNVPFPPPHVREVWDYKNANVENIQRPVSGINWDFIFQGKTVN